MTGPREDPCATVRGPMVRRLVIAVKGAGLREITREVADVVHASGLQEGLCTLFLQHTSASLLIQENADPAARRDLEHWLDRLVPERDPLYTHTAEGPDDMPAHIKAALTATSLSIPILDGSLALGSWQGIYLWEHRRYSSQRHLVIHLGL
jgi:secondary thiamine-phosphate synthase enzyme